MRPFFAYRQKTFLIRSALKFPKWGFHLSDMWNVLLRGAKKHTQNKKSRRGSARHHLFFVHGVQF